MSEGQPQPDDTIRAVLVATNEAVEVLHQATAGNIPRQGASDRLASARFLVEHAAPLLAALQALQNSGSGQGPSTAPPVDIPRPSG